MSALPADFLSRVQLSAVETLEAAAFFADAPSIPVVSDVKGDIESAIKSRAQHPLLAVVALEDAPVSDAGGGHLVISEGRLIVRLREIVTINRGAGSSGETALTAAQAAAELLHGTQITDADGAAFRGAHFTVLGIAPALPDDTTGNAQAVRAWHLTLRFCGGIRPMTRRGTPPAPGGL